jgi:hypothetical protein
MIQASHDELPSEALEELFNSLSSWISSSALLLLMLNASLRQPAVGNRVAATLGSLESIHAQLDSLIVAARCNGFDAAERSGNARLQ